MSAVLTLAVFLWLPTVALLDEAGGCTFANLLRDLGSGVDRPAAFLRHIQRSFVDFAASPEVPAP